MKKRAFIAVLLLAMIAAVCLCVTMTVGAQIEPVSMTDFVGGTPVPEGGYVAVSSKDDVVALRTYVQGGNLTAGIRFVQTAEIDLGANYVSIGTSTYRFKGEYDGGGYKMIVAFKANSADTASLFGYVENAVIKNLTCQLKTNYTTGKGYAGGIASYAVNTKFLNCSMEAKSESINFNCGANGMVGGIAGYADGCIFDGCSASGKLQGVTYVGGIVAQAENGTEIRNCIFSGTTSLKTTEPKAAGGIAGALNGSRIYNCCAAGNVTGYSAVGGLAGETDKDAKIENCFVGQLVTKGTATAEATVGQLVGVNKGTVSNAFARFSNRQALYTLFGDDQGTSSNVYFYRVNSVKNGGETEYAFVFGTVDTVGKEAEVPCAEVNGSCGACDELGNPILDDNGDFQPSLHQVCNGTGVVMAFVYDFTPMEDEFSLTVCGKSGIKTIVEALNAWVSAKNTEAGSDLYLDWVAVGDAIINCSHNSSKYAPYAGSKPTCEGAGRGDLVCATCGKLMETDVEIPPTGHQWSKAGHTCISANKCTVCGADDPNDPAVPDDHTPGDEATCDKPQICIHCEIELVPATGEHIAPEGTLPCASYYCVSCENLIVRPAETHTAPEGTFPCQNFKCTVCSEDVTAGTAHTRPEGTPDCAACQCEVCSGELEALTEHTAPEGVPACQSFTCIYCLAEDVPGKAAHVKLGFADCVSPACCKNCGIVIDPPTGHKWGDEPTCTKAQICKICTEPNPEKPKLGHVKDREKPTCFEPVTCTRCRVVIQKTIAHNPGVAATCGTAQKCTVCTAIVENASGEHQYDNGVIRVAATATSDGLKVFTCQGCGKERTEKVYFAPAAGKGGFASAECAGAILTSSTYLDTQVLKIADISAEAAEGYAWIQAMDIKLVNDGKEAVTPGGKMLVSMKLNDSAKKFTSADLKLYHIDENGTATEMTIKEVKDGLVTFETDHFSVFAVAVNKTTAKTVLGVVGGDTNYTPFIIGGAAGLVVVVALVVILVVINGKKKKAVAGAPVEEAETSDKE